ncbi:MAG: 30S ribosomal protein S6 [Actinomycetota bacterium]
MREYEAMLILSAGADETVVGTAVDRITKAIEPSGGSVGGIDRWGRRRFAFEVDRQTEGYYVVVAFDAEPGTIAPLERALTLADEVMRAKVTIRHPKKVGRTEAPKRSAPRPTAVPAPQAAAPQPPAADVEATTPEPASPETASPETAEEETSPAPA